MDFQWKMHEALQEALAVLMTLGFDEDLFRRCDYATLFNEAVEESERLGLPPELVREKIGEVYDRYDSDALERWTSKDNAIHVLETLARREVLTGLVTNAGKKAVSVLLRRLDLTSLLNVVITRNDVGKLKPHGDGVIKAIHALQVGKRKTLFVGDSVTDIGATLQVGIDIAIVLGGESKMQDIEKCNPKFILHSLSEVLEVI